MERQSARAHWFKLQETAFEQNCTVYPYSFSGLFLGQENSRKLPGEPQDAPVHKLRRLPKRWLSSPKGPGCSKRHPTSLLLGMHG